MTFHATLFSAGKTATGFEVPDDVVAAFGKKAKVFVTINGYTYRSSIASMGGQFLLGVSAEVRAASKVAAGDLLQVTVVPDNEIREVTVPADLQTALADNIQAKAFFEGLSYSNKRWYVLWIESAKKTETRQARILKAVAMLRDGIKQG